MIVLMTKLYAVIVNVITCTRFIFRRKTMVVMHETFKQLQIDSLHEQKRSWLIEITLLLPYKYYSISFSDRPKITLPQKLTWRVNVNDPLIINCEADANPAAAYVWKKSTGEVVGKGGDLSLVNVDNCDGGTYTCTAKNSQGFDNVTVLVKITSKSPKHFWITCVY